VVIKIKPHANEILNRREFVRFRFVVQLYSSRVAVFKELLGASFRKASDKHDVVDVDANFTLERGSGNARATEWLSAVLRVAS
jgi:hypothetical protein